jgi:hypothetical protein
MMRKERCTVYVSFGKGMALVEGGVLIYLKWRGMEKHIAWIMKNDSCSARFIEDSFSCTILYPVTESS